MNNELIEIFNDIYDMFSLNHMRAMDKHIKGDYDLSEKDIFYLDTITHLANPTISNFASAINVTQPAGTQIVNRFIKKGYVTKEVSTADRRISLIRLSVKMEKYVNMYNQIAQDRYDEILSKFSDDDKEQLLALLLKVRDALKEQQ